MVRVEEFYAQAVNGASFRHCMAAKGARMRVLAPLTVGGTALRRCAAESYGPDRVSDPECGVSTFLARRCITSPTVNGASTHPQRPTDDGRLGAEELLPHAVTEDNHVLCPESLVVGNEPTTPDGRNTQHREQTG